MAQNVSLDTIVSLAKRRGPAVEMQLSGVWHDWRTHFAWQNIFTAHVNLFPAAARLHFTAGQVTL